MNLTHTNEPKPKATAPFKYTRKQLWQALQQLICYSSPSPISVRMHPSDIDVDIQMPHDDREAVDQALEFLGMPPGFLCDHRFSAGEPDESRAYGHYLSHLAPRSPLLPGWQVAVWCHVHTHADTLAPLEEVAA